MKEEITIYKFIKVHYSTSKYTKAHKIMNKEENIRDSTEKWIQVY